MISASEVERVVAEGECVHCRDRMQRGVAAFSVERRGYHVHWDAIPARVCMQCGEELFEAREVDVTQRARFIACVEGQA